MRPCSTAKWSHSMRPAARLSNTLQNSGGSGASLYFYVFDVLVLAGHDLTHTQLEQRRGLLQSKVLPKLADPIRYVAPLDGSLSDLRAAVAVMNDALGGIGCTLVERLLQCVQGKVAAKSV